MRRGDTSPDAMREKARRVMEIMQERLRGLGGSWDRVNTINVYAAQSIHGVVENEILKLAGPAAIHGVHWYPSLPPIQGLEFEVDMRGVGRLLVL